MICSSDLETGYGINLIKRVHAVSPSCQRLIVLVRETQAVVREAMDAYADGVMFKSSFGTGQGDFIQALQTLAEGQVYYPEEIRRLSAQVPRPDLPPLVEELSRRDIEVVSAVALGLSNQGVANQCPRAHATGGESDCLRLDRSARLSRRYRQQPSPVAGV